ncbi:MAG: response regulator [bacterium]|nr:response regulator [bacterium]
MTAALHPPNTEPVHILYAEDQEADALFMEQAFLTARAKIVMHFVTDGHAVIEYLGRELRLPDLIFLDINMMRKNGPQTLEEIRAHESWRHIPVIMLSGSALDRDIVSCYTRHANAYVQKPLTFPEMLGFVQAIENFWFFQARLPQDEGAA